MTAPHPRWMSEASLWSALRVVSLGSPMAGTDGVTLEAFRAGASTSIPAVSASLRDGTWRPQHARRVTVPTMPERPIALSTVTDRVVQRALTDALTRQLDRGMSATSFAWRRGRSVRMALAALQAELDAGRRFFAKADVERFFERIDREDLLGRLAGSGVDGATCAVVRRLLQAGVLEGSASWDDGLGLQQGSPLSPVLANLVLDPVDHALSDAGHTVLRYGDDLLALAPDEAAARQALAALRDALAERGLGLRAAKTRIGHVAAGVEWLGVRIDASGARHARAAWRVWSERASERRDDVDALRDLGAAWLKFHGSFDLGSAPDLPSLAAITLAQPDGQGCAARAGVSGEVGPLVAVALVEIWAGLGDDGRLPALLDAALAVRRGAGARELERLGRALGLSSHVVAQLGGDWDTAAQALDEAGRPALADLARSLGAPPKPPPAAPLASAWVDARCGEANGLFAEGIGRAGRGRTWAPARSAEAARVAHRSGVARIGGGPVASDGTTRWLVARWWVRKEARLPSWAPGLEALLPGQARARLDTLDAQALDAALAWRGAAARVGVRGDVEIDGRGGASCWIVFGAAASLGAVRQLAGWLETEVGVPAAELVREVWPPADRVRPPGPVVPIPLGVDPVTGRRGRFVDDRGETSTGPTPGDVVSVRVLREVFAARHPVVREWSPERVGGARASRVLVVCALLRGLAEKADRLGHLTGVERASVLCGLSALRPVGDRDRALTEVLAPAGMQPREIARALAAAPPRPVSCARLRSRHPTLSEGCTCVFEGLPAHAWPTPVLHVMRAGEVEGFRSSPAANARELERRSDRPASGGGTARASGEERGSAAARERTDQGRGRSTGAPTGDPMPIGRLWDRLRELERNAEGLARATEAVREDINRRFDEGSTDRLPFGGGRLVRLSRAPLRLAVEPEERDR